MCKVSPSFSIDDAIAVGASERRWGNAANACNKSGFDPGNSREDEQPVRLMSTSLQFLSNPHVFGIFIANRLWTCFYRWVLTQIPGVCDFGTQKMKLRLLFAFFMCDFVLIVKCILNYRTSTWCGNMLQAPPDWTARSESNPPTFNLNPIGAITRIPEEVLMADTSTGASFELDLPPLLMATSGPGHIPVLRRLLDAKVSIDNVSCRSEH